MANIVSGYMIWDEVPTTSLEDATTRCGIDLAALKKSWTNTGKTWGSMAISLDDMQLPLKAFCWETSGLSYAVGWALWEDYQMKRYEKWLQEWGISNLVGGKGLGET